MSFMQPKPGSRRGRNWPVVILLLPVLSGLDCLPGKTDPSAKKADDPIVIYDLPIMQEITEYEDFVGYTEAQKTVEIRARVTGYLDKVNFEDGSDVNQDAVLFEIDPRPYQATAARTEAGVVQSDAHNKRLDRDVRRAQSLIARGVMPQEEYDKVTGDYAESGGLLASAKADNDLAKLNLSFTRVTAPISGRISRKMVDPGNLVRADDTLLTTIVSLDPMYLYFDIDERTMLRLQRLIREGKIKSRREAEIPVLARLSSDKEDEYPYTGIINFSDNRLDSSTGTLRVRAQIPNPKPYIFTPGLYVKVRLPVGKPRLAVMVPGEAIVSDQGRKFLWVVDKAKEVDKETKVEKEVEVVHQLSVTVGLPSGKMRVIEEGITPGAKTRIVVRGLQRVRPNLRVNAQSMPTSGKTAEVAAPGSETHKPKTGT